MGQIVDSHQSSHISLISFLALPLTTILNHTGLFAIYSNTQSMLQAGLCTCCSFSLDIFSQAVFMIPSITSSIFILKCYLIVSYNTFLNTLMYVKEISRDFWTPLGRLCLRVSPKYVQYNVAVGRIKALNSELF